MANRKVLINRHSTKNAAPSVAEMYLGEIAVSHPEDAISATTIWTKSGDETVMVPFISCAQTIAIIEGMIETSDTDVMVRAGEQHLEVSAGTGAEANKFTLNTKDIQSESAFNAYSADTKTKIDKNASAITDVVNVVSALTNVVLTGISGDTIIVAEVLNPTTGANYVALTHKEAKEVALGFNKVATDKYGHVIDYSAVTTADIQALGFKTSAETGVDLAELSASVVTNKTNIEALSAGTQSDIQALSANTHNKIVEVYGSANSYADAAIAAAVEALDSETTVTAGKYLTGIAIKDGIISGITQEDLPTLSVESAGTGNVVSQITVNGHKISYTTMSVATSDDIQKLSAATIALSSATDSKFTNLSSYTENVDTKVENLSSATLDLSAVTLTGVSMNGSEVTVTDHVAILGDVVTAETQLSTASTGNGNVVTNITVSDHTITLEKGIDALQNVSATGDSYVDASVATNSAITVGLKTTPAQDADDIASASTTGALADAYAVKLYVEDILSSSVDYKGATSGVPANPAKGDLWIAASAFTVGGQNAEVGDFIIYNGSSWDVIEKNLDGAITGNLTADTVTLGAGANNVKSLANGNEGQALLIGTAGTPVWANISDSATTEEGHYTPSATASTEGDVAGAYVKSIVLDSKKHVMSVTTADTVNSATTASAATSASVATNAVHASAATKVDSALTINVLTSAGTTASTVTFDGSQNKNIDIPGYTDTATTESGHYTPSTTASTLGDATGFIQQIKLDSKNHVIEIVSGTTSFTETDVTVADGTTGDAAAAVVTGITTGGTHGHDLTLNKSNKVFSATTSDSALTSVSAQTSVSAVTSQSAQTTVSANMAYELSSAATITSGQVTDIVAGIENTKVHEAESADTADEAEKVAHTLSVSGYANSDSSTTTTTGVFAYDGSNDETLTFGTHTPVGNSMSVSNGVVDVEIIDCGEY